MAEPSAPAAGPKPPVAAANPPTQATLAAESAAAQSESAADAAMAARDRKTNRFPGQPPVAAQPMQIDHAAMAAALVAAQSQINLKTQGQSKTEGLDVAPVPGGIYLVDGKFVNAHGVEVEAPQEKD